jgi:dihydroflavonol-4-reductase
MRPWHQPWPGGRAAVTGATGFLGRHVVSALRRVGAEVVALVRRHSAAAELAAAGIGHAVAPLDDPAALSDALSGCRWLFHVAGAVSFDDWEICREVNVDGTRRVLAAARAAGVRRVVHTSSVVAVGASRRPKPLDETHAWDLARFEVAYVTTKREAEAVALAGAGGDTEVVIVNPTCVVGPDDTTASEFGLLCRRFWRGSVPFVLSGGSNFADVRDVADGHLRAALAGRPGERYLLGGEDRRWRDFFTDLCRVAGRAIPRFPLPTPLAAAVAHLERGRARPRLTVGQARLAGLYFFADSGKARRELGYAPRPLRRTLADAYAWWSGRRRAA